MHHRALRWRALSCAAITMSILLWATAAHAAILVADANTFAQQVFANPAILGVATFDTQADPRTTAVSDTLGTIFPTHGAQFGIISTGLAASAANPNSNDPDEPYVDDESTEFSFLTVRGSSDYDVTVVRIPFTVGPSANCLTMDFQF